ncbi:MAG: SDR family NAD(P)-dependent oxidoreductase [Candidatus Kapabacteria bacterium]|jgi:short-subunit dehydrogenase|nr:SDR family NAD(P)-dependent oxidoreductase [Candidatus Kapabacteria bacterium]
MNIFITGASRGIGRAVAERYAKLGHKVVLAARDLRLLEDLSGSINSSGGESFFCECDVTNIDNMKAAIAFAEDKLGHIDVAVLNAGISGSPKFANMDSEEFKRIFQVNVFGMINGFEAVVPGMKARKSGTIVGVSSLADSRGMPESGAYSASKAAVTHLLDSARIELKHEAVKVINVRPGFVETDMTSVNKFKMPFLMDSKKAATIIIKGIENGKSRIAFPRIMNIAAYILKILPGTIFDFLFRNWKRD